MPKPADIASHNVIGQLGIYYSSGMSFTIRVVDYKSIYSRGNKKLEYKIEPMSGTGSAWVESERVDLI